MKEIDIYDFDKTLLPYDSGSKFALFCFLRYPWCIPLAPVIGLVGVPAALGLIKWGAFKKVCFSFMAFIPREKAVKAFWDRHEKDIYPWFKSRLREAVVISASPDFLLKEIQKRVDFEHLICSVHNDRTGAIIGKNCAKDEKVRRFKKEFGEGDVKVIDVYSDSLENDRPIFALATNKCFHIVDGERREFLYSEKFSR